MTVKSMHRMIMTSNHVGVVGVSGDERRYFVCGVSEKKRGDGSYFAPLWNVAQGTNDTALTTFMHEQSTRDIANWVLCHPPRRQAAIVKPPERTYHVK